MINLFLSYTVFEKYIFRQYRKHKPCAEGGSAVLFCVMCGPDNEGATFAGFIITLLTDVTIKV